MFVLTLIAEKLKLFLTVAGVADQYEFLSMLRANKIIFLHIGCD